MAIQVKVLVIRKDGMVLATSEKDSAKFTLPGWVMEMGQSATNIVPNTLSLTGIEVKNVKRISDFIDSENNLIITYQANDYLNEISLDENTDPNVIVAWISPELLIEMGSTAEHYQYITTGK